MRTRSSIDQLASYADAVAGFAYASFQNVADAQISGHLLDVDRFSLEREAGVSCDDKKLLVTRERRDDFLHHPVREVFLLRVTAHILERQHGDVRLVGKRERLFGVNGRARNIRDSNPSILRSSCVDAHEAVDVFQFPLADAVEGELGLAPYLLEGIGRKIDAPRLALILDPCRHVDAVTENIISVDDDVSDIDPYAKNDMRLGTCSVSLCHLFLNRHRASDRIDGAGELDHHTVAGCLNDAPLMRSDCRINHLAAMRLQCLQRADLVGAHKSAVASNIGHQYSR